MTVLPYELQEKIYSYLPFHKVIYLSKYVALKINESITANIFIYARKDDLDTVKWIMDNTDYDYDGFTEELVSECFESGSINILKYLYSMNQCLLYKYCLCDPGTHEIDMEQYTSRIDTYSEIVMCKGYTCILAWLLNEHIITMDMLNKETLYTYPESKTILFLIKNGYKFNHSDLLFSLIYTKNYDVIDYYSEKHNINMINFASANDLPFLFKHYYLKNRKNCTSETIDCVASIKMLKYICKITNISCTENGPIMAASRNNLVLLKYMYSKYKGIFNTKMLDDIKYEARLINSTEILKWCSCTLKRLKNKK